MLQLTKIFQFETAHAIHGYSGPCRHIHGHSYELHVTVSAAANGDEYIPVPGLEIDFKDLKQLVGSLIIEKLDHKLILSRGFVTENPGSYLQENLEIWKAEPTVENMVIYIRRILEEKLPPEIRLSRLKLFETSSSYAEWLPDRNQAAG